MKRDHVISFRLLPARFRLFRRDPIWSLAAAARGLVVDARLRRAHGAHIAGVLGAAEHLLLGAVAVAAVACRRVAAMACRRVAGCVRWRQVAARACRRGRSGLWLPDQVVNFAGAGYQQCCCASEMCKTDGPACNGSSFCLARANGPQAYAFELATQGH